MLFSRRCCRSVRRLWKAVNRLPCSGAKFLEDLYQPFHGGRQCRIRDPNGYRPRLPAAMGAMDHGLSIYFQSGNILPQKAVVKSSLITY